MKLVPPGPSAASGHPALAFVMTWIRHRIGRLTLRVMSVRPSVRTLAPFEAAVVQVAGCGIGCERCCAAETWRRDAGVEVLVAKLADYLACLHVPGIVLTGGEPTDQAPALNALLTCLGPDPLVALYSGYTIEALRSDRRPGVADVLARADLLSAGPFVEKLAGTYAMAGSANQVVLALSERVPVPDRHLGVEIHVAADGAIEFIGIPTPNFVATWRSKAAALGVELRTTPAPSLPVELVAKEAP